MRWQDNFARGDRVETLVYFATGKEWRPGFVARKTASGNPVVTVPARGTSVSLVVDRKTDIRQQDRARRSWRPKTDSPASGLSAHARRPWRAKQQPSERSYVMGEPGNTPAGK